MANADSKENVLIVEDGNVYMYTLVDPDKGYVRSNLIGKTIEEAKNFIQNFEHMILEEDYEETILNEAIVYNEIYKQNNRKNCALLPYQGIKKILEQQK